MTNQPSRYSEGNKGDPPRYSEGSMVNRAWRWCHKCGTKELIDDRDGVDVDAPRHCPKCKQVMSKRKPMSETLETK